MVENIKIVYRVDDAQIDALLKKFSNLSAEEREQIKLMLQLDTQTATTTRNAGKNFDGLNKTVANLRNTIIAAFAVDKVIKFGSEVIEVAKRFEAMNNAIKFASGSAAEYQKNTQFLADITRKLGIDLESASKGFKTIMASAKPAGISAEETRSIFEGMSTAISAMGLSSQDAEGTFLALGQMLSKGTVQAEELRGQIGERIPGAFNLAAQSMGVTTRELNKMLEQGQVVANDFVPKFAKTLQENFSPALKESANSLNAVSSRADNAYKSLQLTFGAAGQGTYKLTLDIITQVLEGMNKFISGNKKTVSSVDLVVDAVEKERTELNTLVKSIRNQNISNEARTELINELNKKFPEFAKSIDVVKASENELEGALKGVNKQFDLQVFNVASAEIRKNYQKENNDLIKKEAELIKEVEKVRAGNYEIPLSGGIKGALEYLQGGRKITGEGEIDERVAQIFGYIEKIKRQRVQLQIDEEQELKVYLDRLKNKGLTVQDANEKELRERKKNNIITGKVDKKAQDDLAKQQAEFALRELEAQQKLAIDKIKAQIDFNNLVLKNDETNNFEKIEIIRANQRLESDLLTLKNETNKKTYEIDKDNIIQVKKLTKTELLNIDNETSQARVLLEQKTNNELKELDMGYIADGAERAEKRAKDALDTRLEIMKKERAMSMDFINAQIEDEKRKEAQIAKIKEASYNLGVALINGLFDINKNNTEKELTELQTSKDYELQLAGDNKNKQIEINQRFAEKERELKRKQASADKDKAIFDILLQTSVNVVKAYATLPPTNLILAGFAAAIGLLQVTAVSSRPIPKFRGGVDYLNSQATGKDADGVIIEAHLGERILPKHLNDRIKHIPNHLIPQLVLGNLNNNKTQELNVVGLGEQITDAISKIPLNSINLNEDGFEKYISQKGNETRIFNKNTSW